jgi:hypothetical protein
MSDDARFIVTPKSTDPEDVADALLAEKLLNHPVSIEAFDREFRRRMRILLAGNYVEYWDPVEPQ